jgi:hypothetical protein
MGTVGVTAMGNVEVLSDVLEVFEQKLKKVTIKINIKNLKVCFPLFSIIFGLRN